MQKLFLRLDDYPLWNIDKIQSLKLGLYFPLWLLYFLMASPHLLNIPDNPRNSSDDVHYNKKYVELLLSISLFASRTYSTILNYYSQLKSVSHFKMRGWVKCELDLKYHHRHHSVIFHEDKETGVFWYLKKLTCSSSLINFSRFRFLALSPLHVLFVGLHTLSMYTSIIQLRSNISCLRDMVNVSQRKGKKPETSLIGIFVRGRT